MHRYIVTEATIVFVIAVIIQGCASTTTIVQKDQPVVITIPGTSANTSSWEECITNANCTEIISGGVPVEHPRKDRYADTSGNADLQLRITKADMSDGGRYVGRVESSTLPADSYIVDLVVVDQISCNGSDSHSAKIGEDVTYTCSMKYQGLPTQQLAAWDGPWVQTFIMSMQPVAEAQQNTCYSGEATWDTTLTMTDQLNGSRRNFTFVASPGSSSYFFLTGKLLLVDVEVNATVTIYINKTKYIIDPVTVILGKSWLPYLWGFTAIPVMIIAIVAFIWCRRSSNKEDEEKSEDVSEDDQSSAPES